MHEKELYEARLLGDMDKALEEHQFMVVFQPKYDITTDTPRLCSAEVLIRWKHPEFGFVRPDSFMPLFEENGRIKEAGQICVARGGKNSLSAGRICTVRQCPFR